MTQKQMVRAMLKWGISVVYDEAGNRWYAGECTGLWDYQVLHEARIMARHGGSLHVGILPQEAVEDYCNARNLEWDR